MKRYIILFILFILFAFCLSVVLMHSSDPVEEHKDSTAIRENDIESIESLSSTLQEMKEDFNKDYPGNYNCVFTKQERINGKLLEKQTIDVSVKKKPRAISFSIRNGDVATSTWEEGWDYVKVNCRGVKSVLGEMKIDFSSSAYKKSTLKPASNFGYVCMLDTLISFLPEADVAYHNESENVWILVKDGKKLTIKMNGKYIYSVQKTENDVFIYRYEWVSFQ